MSKKHYFHQLAISYDYVIPLLKSEGVLHQNSKVLEVGCAEAGLVKALTELNIDCIGIELLQARIDTALNENPQLPLHQGDITDETLVNRHPDLFDLIVIRDVIEHIPDQEKAIKVMYSLLRPGGHLYITFPPLYSPYAGHQQNGKGIFKAFLWIHLLPNFIIKAIGKIQSTPKGLVDEVILNSKIGLTISRFEKIFKSQGFEQIKNDLFFLRPIYKIRWGWPVVRFPQIPILRECFATGCEYLLKKA